MENKKYPSSYLGFDWLTCMLDKRWIPHVKSILKNKQDPRHITVLYEELVKDPVNEIAKVASWLGLKSPPRSDTQTLFYDLDANLLFNPSKKGVKTPKKAIPDLQRKFNYQEILTQREIDLINYKTGPYLEGFGYEKMTRPTLPGLMLSHILPDKWEFMHCDTYKLKLRGLFGAIVRRASIFS